MNENKSVPLIAICGHPGVGKSTLQTILAQDYGIVPVDDGAIIREHVMQILDLDYETVSTQEGKARKVRFCGRDWVVREALGEYGNLIEAMFGEHAIPRIAVRRVLREHAEHSKNIGYSFGSVRRNQGQVYQDTPGGAVVEITRPGVAESPYEFDRYDTSLVRFRIHNDIEGVEALRQKVAHSDLAAWIRNHRERKEKT